MKRLLSRLVASVKKPGKSGGAAPRKHQTRLRIEALEDRLVATVSYFSYASGTWAYNQNTSAWRKISNARPVNMSGNDTSLYAGYSNGTFSYNYDSNTWTKLSNAVPIALSHGNPTLYASYRSGTWEIDDGRWTKLTNAVATQIAAIGPYGAFDATFASGLWNYQGYNNTWTKILNAPPSRFAVSGSGLVVSNSSGTWLNSYSTDGWKKLTSEVATNLVMIDTNDFYATFASGSYRYNNGTWSRLTAAVATKIGAGSTGYQEPVFVGSFSNGTWVFQVTGWKQITAAKADMIA